MKKLLAYAKAAFNLLKRLVVWLWNDPKALRRLAALFALMSAFGITDPDTSTALRDAVLAMAF